jgi:Putative phage metallopeptidase
MPLDELPTGYRWNSFALPPRLALRLSGRRPILASKPPAWLETGPISRPFDFTTAIRILCEDIVRHSPPLAHIDLSRVLFTMIRARNGRGHGLQARVTPMRFRAGSLTSTYRGREYRVQRFEMDGQEILYVVGFTVPRFLNRDYRDKLVTVFHELYHISPAFDGDLRRHAGRCSAHTHSQKKYDAHMDRLVTDYLKRGADPIRSAFLRLSFAQLCRRHGAVVGLHLPRPKLIPVTPPPRPEPPLAPSTPDRRQ